MAVSSRKSKVYTISLPPKLAKRAEALARKDCYTMSELFREAFRAYSTRQARTEMEAIGEYASAQNPNGYTEADVPRLIKEARSEKPVRRRARVNG